MARAPSKHDARVSHLSVEKLSDPRVPALYRQIRGQWWVRAFLDSNHDVYARIGCELLIAELETALDPAREEVYRDGSKRRRKKRTPKVRCQCGKMVATKLDGQMTRRHACIPELPWPPIEGLAAG